MKQLDDNHVELTVSDVERLYWGSRLFPRTGDLLEYPYRSGKAWSVTETEAGILLTRRAPVPKRVQPKSTRKSRNKSKHVNG